MLLALLACVQLGFYWGVYKFLATRFEKIRMVVAATIGLFMGFMLLDGIFLFILAYLALVGSVGHKSFGTEILLKWAMVKCYPLQWWFSDDVLYNSPGLLTINNLLTSVSLLFVKLGWRRIR